MVTFSALKSAVLCVFLLLQFVIAVVHTDQSEKRDAGTTYLLGVGKADITG